jgi:hypothetical protein
MTLSIPKEIREKLDQLAKLYDDLPDWRKGRLEYLMGPKNDEPRPPAALKE